MNLLLAFGEDLVITEGGTEAVVGLDADNPEPAKVLAAEI